MKENITSVLFYLTIASLARRFVRFYNNISVDQSKRLAIWK